MKAIAWQQDALSLLDQTKLPHETLWNRYETAEAVAEAIRTMKVRGAPAIGASAAFGLAVEAHRLRHSPSIREDLLRASSILRVARPTAVNLAQALDIMEAVLHATPDEALADALYAKAVDIAVEDVRTNQKIGDFGADALHGEHLRILTHCNTGSLATVGYGTALGVIRSLHSQGRLDQVYVDETRPYLQGARLTAFELREEGIPFDVITDSMAGYVMQQGFVDAVIVGADRVAKNGDTANKIGTYALAVLAHYHNIPFYVAVPKSTIDLQTNAGEEIPIEQRAAKEVTHLFDQMITPEGTSALHPAFDVTPCHLIRGFITEYGLIQAPYEVNLAKLFEEGAHRS